MIDVLAWERDVRLIGELCVELASLGMKVRLTDARPSLFVRCAGDDRLHRIEVRGEGECFAWARGRHQHVATDPKGAASRIAAFVRQAEPNRQSVINDTNGTSELEISRFGKSD